ncbi:hypothetical protein AB6A23_07235 [Paenibacillus tarimensis]
MAFHIFLFVGPEKVQACSCAEPPAVEDELKRKTAVFAGKVKSISHPKPALMRSSVDPVKITFDVTTVWKGEVKPETEVYTAISSASCGYDGFIENEDYIVFAFGDSDRLQTGLCERTKPLASAEEELAALGEGQMPSEPAGFSSLKQAGDPYEDYTTVFIKSAITIAAITAGAVIVIALWKRRRY